MTYSQICHSYNGKCLMALLDVVGLLVDVCSDQLTDPKAVEIISTPLLNKLTALDYNDKMIFPVLKCMIEVVKALGRLLSPVTNVITQK